MDNYKIIYLKDVGNEDYIGGFGTIKEKNEYLYKNLMIHLQKKDSPGIRSDVFDVLVNDIDKIIIDSQFAFHISFLLGNFKIIPEYYTWLIDYYSSSPAVDINNITIVLSESVEKGISFDEIRERFEKCGGDFLEVFEFVDHYNEPTGEEEVVEEDTVEDTEKTEIVQTENKVQIMPEHRDENLASVFGDLYTVMSSGRIEDTSTIQVQKNFNTQIAHLQTFVNDITSFSTNVCHEWEKDKEEITRLKSLISIQQRTLTGIQQKLYEEREKNNRLMDKLREAEKLKMHLENQKKKVRELEQLSLESEKIFADN